MILITILILIVSYFSWDRYFRLKLRMSFYDKQGVKMLNFVPFFGGYVGVIKYIKENKPNIYPIIDYINHVFGIKPPAFVGFVFGR